MSYVSLAVTYTDGSGRICTGAITREQCYTKAFRQFIESGAPQDVAKDFARKLSEVVDFIAINYKTNIYTSRAIGK